jgi:hypothetical protein
MEVPVQVHVALCYQSVELSRSDRTERDNEITVAVGRSGKRPAKPGAGLLHGHRADHDVSLTRGDGGGGQPDRAGRPLPPPIIVALKRTSGMPSVWVSIPVSKAWAKYVKPSMSVTDKPASSTAARIAFPASSVRVCGRDCPRR